MTNFSQDDSNQFDDEDDFCLDLRTEKRNSMRASRNSINVVSATGLKQSKSKSS